MALVANCKHHGQYVNTCGKCLEERPLITMADDILAGMEPLAALRKALDHKRKTEQEIVAKKADFERRRRIKEFARAQWIQQNLPKNLQDDSVIY